MSEARACGSCTVCCSALGIDTRQIQKKSGALCRHCNGGGCAIYEARPATCREFHCAWMEGALDENWRPDVSGVLAQTLSIQGRQGFSLQLVADPLKTVRQDWFVAYVQASLRDGLPLVLAVPGPDGTRSAKLFLNTDDMRRAAAGSPEQMRQQLRQAVKTLLAAPFEALPLLNTGNDVSS